MIGFLTGLGLGKRAAQVVAFVVVPLVVLGAFYLALDAYGDARYDAGKVEADRQWEAAAARLEEKSDAAAAAADVPAEVREQNWAAQVAAEKEKIDAAVADGGDPIDVLFPVGL